MTTYQNLKTKAHEGFKNYPIEELKVRAKDLMENFEEGVNLVFNILLDYLEDNMTEKDYITFCESL